MTKEAFVSMVQWLRKWHCEIEEIANMLEWVDIYESKIIKFDEVIDQFCAVGGLDPDVREAIDSLIWDGCISIKCTDMNNKEAWLQLDEAEYWEVFLNPQKN